MDRESQKMRRQAYAAIVITVLIFFFAIVGLVIMSLKSIDVTAVKVLRSEMASKIANRETMDCTASWVPADAYEFPEDGAVSNPKKISVTFAMSDGGNTFYLDRYFDGRKYMSFYAKDGDYYVWSAMRRLMEAGQLYDYEFRHPMAENAKLTEDEFNKLFPNFFDEVDQMIRDFPAGTSIFCNIGGTMGYSQPKDAEWETLDTLKEKHKEDTGIPDWAKDMAPNKKSSDNKDKQ